MNDGELAGQIQHPGVRTDQTIPNLEMVQGQQKLPVVHLPEPQIDVTNGNQLCLWDAKPESIDDGVGKSSSRAKRITLQAARVRAALRLSCASRSMLSHKDSRLTKG